MELFEDKNIIANNATALQATTSHYAAAQVREIITDNVLYYFDYVLSCSCCLLSFLGVIANLLNVIIYWKQGFKVSVNITFITISVWDLGNSFLSGLSVISAIIETCFPVPGINFMSLQYVYFGYTRGFMYVLSTQATVYLSVERCICIMVPLKVKSIFTKTRVILIHFIIIIFGLINYSPAWATQGMQLLLNHNNNKTRLELWLSSTRREVDIFVDTFNGMVTPLVAQVLITVSAGYMVKGIKTSTKFRQKATKTEKLETSGRISTESVSKSVKPETSNRKNIMTNIDIRLTKVVIFMAMIFFACNLPVFIVALIRTLLSDVDVGKAQYNFYKILYRIIYQCSLINSVVFIIVYYHVSTRYREVFLKVICVNMWARRRPNASLAVGHA